MTEILLCLFKQFVSYDRAKTEKIGDFFVLTWLIFVGPVTCDVCFSLNIFVTCRINGIIMLVNVCVSVYVCISTPQSILIRSTSTELQNMHLTSQGENNQHDIAIGTMLILQLLWSCKVLYVTVICVQKPSKFISDLEVKPFYLIGTHEHNHSCTKLPLA